jgi:hypothetical protein
MILILNAGQLRVNGLSNNIIRTLTIDYKSVNQKANITGIKGIYASRGKFYGAIENNVWLCNTLDE